MAKTSFPNGGCYRGVPLYVEDCVLSIPAPLPSPQITQFSEVDEVYPGWAQFIGAMIILIAVLPIPIVLIVRLILYQSARDEAISFFKSIKTDAENLFRYISHLRLVVLLLVLYSI